MTRTILPLATIAVLAGCTSSGTKLMEVWKDPNTAVFDCNKTLVTFASKNATMRAVVEDQLVERIRNSVAARSAIDNRLTKDVEKFKAEVRAQNFDCAVVVRFLAMEQTTEYTPARVYSVPSGYGGFYGYYGAAWTNIYEPGYETEKVTVFLETNIYDVKQDSLIWAAKSRTVNPDQAESVVDDLVDEAVKSMRKDKLIE